MRQKYDIFLKISENTKIQKYSILYMKTRVVEINKAFIFMRLHAKRLASEQDTYLSIYEDSTFNNFCTVFVV